MAEAGEEQADGSKVDHADQDSLGDEDSWCTCARRVPIDMRTAMPLFFP